MVHARLLLVLCVTAGAVLPSLAACSGDDVQEGEQCAPEPISRFKELSVVDEGVLTDARSSNAGDGPWSFRSLVENMAPEGTDPGEFVRTWLVDWVTVKEVNGFALDPHIPQEGVGRDVGMNKRIVCPWLKLTPENACDDTCTTCKAQKLDLAKAPFRLIAIVNRLDLRDEVAAYPSGEGRLVFGLTDGPADDPASSPLAMSVIFEFALPASTSPREWAEKWHALGKFSSFDESYRAALEGVTRSFTSRGSDPLHVNGSAIGQVRTNESVLNWIWQQREFGLDSGGNLRLRPIRNTPAEAINGTPFLRDHVVKNREAILAKKYEMPAGMRAGAADQLQYVWSIPDVDEPLRKAFAGGTCNGCHSTENPNVDTAFHVSPRLKGVEKLSPFVNDPSGSGKDDLTNRENHMRRTLCER